MPVERVVAGIETPAGKPAIERGFGVVEYAIPVGLPIDCGGGLGPEFLRVFERAAIKGIVFTHD